jgi:hypothetical protein
MTDYGEKFWYILQKPEIRLFTYEDHENWSTGYAVP